MLALYGHPFSSYTWKAQIALHALDLPYDFRLLGEDQPEHAAFVAREGGPYGLFPVLDDGGTIVFEATAIIEHLALKRPGTLLPLNGHEAVRARMMDRVFDNYVMTVMQGAVNEYIRHPDAPDAAVLCDVRERLHRSYAWLEKWLGGRPLADGRVTLVECAAAPSLFYADWVEPVGDGYPLLAAWRAHLNALPEVIPCIEAARPYRPWFPPGAPDRD